MTSIIIPGPESDANANLIIRSGSHLTLPSGDDSGRTVAGFTNEPGAIRYNTAKGVLEYYKNTTVGWVYLLDVESPITTSNKPLYLDSSGKIVFQNIPLSNIDGIASTGTTKDLLVRANNAWEARTVSGELSVNVTTTEIQYSIGNNFVTGKTELTSSATDDVLLIYDTDTTQLKKITKANLLSGYLTSVPIATTSTVGVVKPDGSTVTIDANGTLSVGGSGGGSLLTADGTTIINNSGIISAATATSSAKGIVQPDNSTITISNGVISAVAASGLESRTTISQSQSITAGATGNIDFAGTAFKSYLILKAAISHAAWVTLYTDSASRSADTSRSQGTDPTPGSGVLLDVVTTGNQTVLITPGTFGFNNDTSPVGTIYASVRNNSGATATITLSLTIVKLEN